MLFQTFSEVLFAVGNECKNKKILNEFYGV
jgi:hypothetical protein